MKGVVSEVKQSKSGKSYSVMIGGARYSAKLDSKIDQAMGKAIDFSVDPSDYKGTTINWVRDWDFDRNPAQETTTLGAIVPASAKVATPVDRFYMPFISNVIAHAIQAGLIKDPTQLGPWARAAYRLAVVELDRAFEEKKGKFEDSMSDVPF
jgi:hypothetical protein